MKKTLSFLMALCMLIGCLMAFSACGEKKELGYMNSADLDGDGEESIKDVNALLSLLAGN